MKRDRLLLALSLAHFALFVPLAWWASKHPQPLAEIMISRFTQRKQSPFKRRVVIVFNTMTGSAALLNVLVVPVAAWLWRKRLRLEAIMTLAISWTSVLVRTGVKQVTDRPRPFPLFVRATKKRRKRSFPSGHVVASINFWGWLFTLGILKGSNRPWSRILLGFPHCLSFLTVPLASTWAIIGPRMCWAAICLAAAGSPSRCVSILD